MLAAIGTAAVAFVLYAGYRIENADLSGCADAERLRELSPDRSYTAVASVRDCGATTRYSTVVSLIPSGTGADDATDTLVFVAKDICNVDVSWGADSLAIAYPQSCEIVRATTMWRSVHIVLKPR